LKSSKEKGRGTRSRKSSAKGTPASVEPVIGEAEALSEAPSNGTVELARAEPNLTSVTAELVPMSTQPELVEPTHASAEAVNGAAAVAAPEPDNGVATRAEALPERVGDMAPPRELIAVRAYELFARRGYVHGHHVDDWLAAERELRQSVS
jgi:hypothetical protein